MAYRCYYCKVDNCLQTSFSYQCCLREIQGVRSEKLEEHLIKLAEELSPRHHEHVVQMIMEEIQFGGEYRVVNLFKAVGVLAQKLGPDFVRRLETWIPEIFSGVYLRVQHRTYCELKALKDLEFPKYLSQNCLEEITKYVQFLRNERARMHLRSTVQQKPAAYKPLTPPTEGDDSNSKLPVFEPVKKSAINSFPTPPSEKA